MRWRFESRRKVEGAKGLVVGWFFNPGAEAEAE
jgi:hypothetical protein